MLAKMTNSGRNVYGEDLTVQPTFAGAFARAFSSSDSLESSLDELSAAVFAFLADGPLAASDSTEVTFRFRASGDLINCN